MVRIHKRFGPVRITVSKSGVGYSAGSGPIRITKRADGPRATNNANTRHRHPRHQGDRRSAATTGTSRVGTVAFFLLTAQPLGPVAAPRPAPAQPPPPSAGPAGGEVLLVLLAVLCSIAAMAAAAHGIIVPVPLLAIPGAIALWFAKIVHSQRH